VLAPVAPPGFSTPDGDSGGGGGGWSTDTKIAVVVGGLLVVAAGLAGLATAYWRSTRPVAPAGAGAAASPTDAMARRPASGPDPAPLVGAAAVGTAAAARPTSSDDAPPPATTPPAPDPTATAATAATPQPVTADPLMLLLAGEDGLEPGGSGATSAPTTRPDRSPSVGPVAHVAPTETGSSPSGSPPASEADELARKLFPDAAVEPVVPQVGPSSTPTQSSGVRVMGPVEPAPIVTREDLGHRDATDEGTTDQQT
jgi:hypothetical protein